MPRHNHDPSRSRRRRPGSYHEAARRREQRRALLGASAIGTLLVVLLLVLLNTSTGSRVACTLGPGCTHAPAVAFSVGLSGSERLLRAEILADAERGLLQAAAGDGEESALVSLALSASSNGLDQQLVIDREQAAGITPEQRISWARRHWLPRLHDAVARVPRGAGSDILGGLARLQRASVVDAGKRPVVLVIVGDGDLNSQADRHRDDGALSTSPERRRYVKRLAAAGRVPDFTQNAHHGVDLVLAGIARTSGQRRAEGLLALWEGELARALVGHDTRVIGRLDLPSR